MMQDTMDAILSYLAAFMSFMLNIDWMSIGGIVLLVARLVVDVPRAFMYIKEQLNGSDRK